MMTKYQFGENDKICPYKIYPNILWGVGVHSGFPLCEKFPNGKRVTELNIITI